MVFIILAAGARHAPMWGHVGERSLRKALELHLKNLTKLFDGRRLAASEDQL
jgi:hypothetical protein